ncbi:Chitin synthase, class 3, partial [Gonapodya sp. JEL0774]
MPPPPNQNSYNGGYPQGPPDGGQQNYGQSSRRQAPQSQYGDQQRSNSGYSGDQYANAPPRHASVSRVQAQGNYSRPPEYSDGNYAGGGYQQPSPGSDQTLTNNGGNGNGNGYSNYSRSASRSNVNAPPRRSAPGSIVMPAHRPVVDDSPGIPPETMSTNMSRRKSLVRPERNRGQRDRRPPVPGVSRDDDMGPAPIAPTVAHRSTASRRNINSQGSLSSQPLVEGSTVSSGRPVRSRSILLGRAREPVAAPQRRAREEDRPASWWRYMTLCLTCCYPPFMLEACGMKTVPIRHAWREKVALVTIIIFICGMVGFITFGFNQAVCGAPTPRVPQTVMKTIGYFSVHGKAYSTIQTDKSTFIHPTTTQGAISLYEAAVGKDIGFLFPVPTSSSACAPYAPKGWTNWNCTALDVWPRFVGQAPVCHLTNTSRSALSKLTYQGEVFYEWTNITESAPKQRAGNVTVQPPLLVVYNGDVLDVFRLLAENPKFMGDDVYNIILSHLGGDMTAAMSNSAELRGKARCLSEIFKVGVLEPNTPGCIISQIVLYVSLVFIVAIVVIKFMLAVLFSWSLSWRLGDSSATRKNHHPPTKGPLSESMVAITPNGRDMAMSDVGSGNFRARRVPDGAGGIKVEIVSADERGHKSDTDSIMTSGSQASSIMPNAMWKPRQIPEGWRSDLMHIVLMITCYSEGYDSMSQTIDSLALTDYPDERKLLLIVCDGIIHGAGNDKPTPDIVMDLIIPATDVLNPIRFPDPPIEGSYVAI